MKNIFFILSILSFKLFSAEVDYSYCQNMLTMMAIPASYYKHDFNSSKKIYREMQPEGYHVSIDPLFKINMDDKKVNYEFSKVPDHYQIKLNSEKIAEGTQETITFRPIGEGFPAPNNDILKIKWVIRRDLKGRLTEMTKEVCPRGQGACEKFKTHFNYKIQKDKNIVSCVPSQLETRNKVISDPDFCIKFYVVVQKIEKNMSELKMCHNIYKELVNDYANLKGSWEDVIGVEDRKIGSNIRQDNLNALIAGTQKTANLTSIEGDGNTLMPIFGGLANFESNCKTYYPESFLKDKPTVSPAISDMEDPPFALDHIKSETNNQ